MFSADGDSLEALGGKVDFYIGKKTGAHIEGSYYRTRVSGDTDQGINYFQLAAGLIHRHGKRNIRGEQRVFDIRPFVNWTDGNTRVGGAVDYLGAWKSFSLNASYRLETHDSTEKGLSSYDVNLTYYHQFATKPLFFGGLRVGIMKGISSYNSGGILARQDIPVHARLSLVGNLTYEKILFTGEAGFGFAYQAGDKRNLYIARASARHLGLPRVKVSAEYMNNSTESEEENNFLFDNTFKLIVSFDF
jgi:hypothetical protein